MPGPPAARPAARPRPLPRRTLRSGLPPVQARPKTPSAPAASGRPPRATPATADTPLPPPATVAPAAHALSLRGDYWQVTYEGQTAIVEDCRGLRYIALLLQRAGTDPGPIHAKELAAMAAGEEPDLTELEMREPVLDKVAQQQLLERLREIASDRDRAAATEDFDRATALDDEYERIAAELSRARAPQGGRRGGGAFNHAGERARKAVAKAISEAIARIETHAALGSLAEHLTSSIRKGQWLSYTGTTAWHVDLRLKALGSHRSSLELIFVGRAFTARQAPRKGAPYIKSSELRCKPGAHVSWHVAGRGFR